MPPLMPPLTSSGQILRIFGTSRSFSTSTYVADEAMTEIETATDVTENEDGGNSFTTQDTCSCESCKAIRFEPNKLKESVIHCWNYKPRRWIPKSVKDDHISYYMGVELETVTTPECRLWDTIAADMRRPKRFWVSKHDSSVSGPEFASHPATMTWWHAHQREFAEMFKMLIHSGYRSHEGAKAGMHVNISRTAFTSWRHYSRFLSMIYGYPLWSVVMSQRDTESVRDWCRVENMRPHDWESVAYELFTPYSTYYTDKYVAVNAPRYEGRFEFRLPRGTLRLDRFFKNLEWTFGMIEFTRNLGGTESSPHEFMDWVQDTKDGYKNLIQFLNEKKDILSLHADTKGERL